MLHQQKIQTIPGYIAQFPSEVQDILNTIYRIIKEVAPNAEESISYGIPTFKLNGPLVYFGGFTKHVSLFPLTSTIEDFKEELQPYKVSKGTIQFPLNKPIPYDLIRKIVEYRVGQNLNKSK